MYAYLEYFQALDLGLEGLGLEAGNVGLSEFVCDVLAEVGG